jgi:hypothetical protein
MNKPRPIIIDEGNIFWKETITGKNLTQAVQELTQEYWESGFAMGKVKGRQEEQELRVYHVDCPKCIAKGKSEAEEETQKKIEKLKEEILNSSCGDEAGIDINRFIICGEDGMIDKIFSPRINVEGKPMIPPTPKTSGKDNLVTEDKLSRKEEIEKEIETLGNFGSQDKSNIMGQLKARLDERIRVEQDFLKMIDEIDCSCLGVHSKKDCFKEELKSLLQDKKQ